MKDFSFTIFKPAERYCQSFSREAFQSSISRAPVRDNTPAFVECRLLTTVKEGEHSIFLGEVVETGVNQKPERRADDVTLLLKDLGENTFSGRCMDFIL